ncbi:MAG: hypothetical protein AB1742_15895 [bacterium]
MLKPDSPEVNPALRKAFDLHAQRARRLAASDPDLDPLRDRPAFVELLNR